MRVAHITDLHVEVPPQLAQLLSKRALGAVNLYLLGRSAHFAKQTVEALVAAVVRAEPDLVVCTGDITSTATPQEFELAAALLAPLTERFPFLVLPGNHDVYTNESMGRFQAHFGAWSNGGIYPYVQHFNGVDFVALDVSRPDFLSRGLTPRQQLETLDGLLGSGSAPAVVLLHYPLRDRRGDPYGPFTRNLENAVELEKVLGRHPRVVAVLHGHEHHGYRTTIPRDGVPILSLNPGASGYAFLPDRRRTAHFNLYDIHGGQLGVERFAFDGAAFAPEVGG
ncbi:MAG: metallophosphoesterase family protein, partial [Myxococcota bacterium]